MTKKATKPKAKIGRPAIAPEARRTVQIKVLVTESERADLQTLADADRRSVAEWARVRLLELARKRA